ncbi:c-type cytochrome [Paludibacterium yongneupense]|uniref:c-type cytochrome n=1 Tax=Paludibacterium yongneupense TaxID=400061 RepID=UPI00041AF712|nr:c-type cytochrome [Paludibacterium yongneupense]
MNNESVMAPVQIVKFLIGVVVFLVVAIFLLAKLATSGFDINAEVMTKEAISARLKPVGESIGSEGVPGSRNGESVYKAVCVSCHGAGLLGSPKFGDTAAWAPRIGQGFEVLLKHALGGFNAMPAKGGSSALSDDEVGRAVAFMANAGGATFKEPKAADASAAAAAPAPGNASSGM